MEGQLKSLKSKRGSIKTQLTCFNKYFDKIKNQTDVTAETVTELEQRLQKIEPLWDNFNEIQSEIEIISENVDAQIEYREQFQDIYFKSIASSKQFILKFGVESAEVDNQSIVSRESHINQGLGNIKLPTINLPSFDGTFTHWREFYDTFRALIHTNTTISDAQKFCYLRASLKGEASHVIQSFETSDVNYRIAFDLLKERYENKRRIIHTHSRALLELTSITKESHQAMRQLIDTAQRHIRCLESLEQPVGQWDALLVPLISSKLDPVTNKEWESQINSASSRDEIPTITALFAFLTHRHDILEAVATKKTPTDAKATQQHSTRKSFFASSVTCPHCSNGSHGLYNCSSFLKLPVNARMEEVKKLKLCINCLRNGHFSKDCKSISCRKCKSMHNTLLHYDRPALGSDRNIQANVPSSPTNDKTPEPTAQVSLIGHLQTGSNVVLLATASLLIFDKHGLPQYCRALLDSGSQSNFISTELCDTLGIAKRRADISIVGINQIASKTNSSCEVTIQSRLNRFKISLSCLVLTQICENLPCQRVDISQLNIPKHICLADPDFNNPGKIDLLLGADFFWQFLCVGQVSLGPNKPVLQKSKFGWLLSGPVQTQLINRTLCNLSKNIDVQEQLASFWETEECITDKILSIEEKTCEAHFIDTVKRNSNGRFVVSIPLKDSLDKLGNSRDQAQRRFFSLERKLLRNHVLGERYIQFMSEYESMGHMSKVDDVNDSRMSYYMPHHGVMKEDSMTTKLRVVFDGSFPTSSGYSINDLQMVGPTIQNDLLSILLRFRQHTIVVSADIEKMYRQVLVTPEQRSMQRILWRSHPTNPLLSYELNTVTYGTAAASFLSIRCLQQLSFENAGNFPIASQIIANDFYVDDLLSGADTIEEASLICTQVTDILRQGCFELRKWVSNMPNFLQDVLDSDSPSHILNFGSNENTKTLGLLWSCHSDDLMYNIQASSISNNVTKRTILSGIAQIFDPLGLLSACTISAKIILQRLWQEKLSWDESVPLDIHTNWVQFRQELLELNNLRIPRHVILKNPRKIEIHGFCDSSEAAYGCCIYVRSISPNGRVQVRLMCAKSRVAPLKSITLPRLELCGALILARVAKKVTTSLTVSIDEHFFWSDSTIVLAWINTPANLLKTFVAHRVSEIQESANPNHWRHVVSKDNPADLVSRGVSPSTLKASSLWWNGPSWLAQDAKAWPHSEAIISKELPELKNQTHSFTTTLSFDIFARYSSVTKLQNTVSYCLRFFNNAKLPREGRTVGPLTVTERTIALHSLIKMAQLQCFEKELYQLSKTNHVKSNSKLLSLRPFLDNNKILRVGGRLGHSTFAFDKCHPIILSSNHPLTEMIVRHEHRRLLHCGPQSLLSSLRETYWPVSGRNLAKKVVRQCITCFRNSPKAPQLLMGDLPQARITPSPPFHNCGIDYAGPLFTRDRSSRGYKTFKSYVCLFVCFATKAVHLELVSDMTTECFLASLRRFVSRRGKPQNIYSDNGTNFVGANNELQNLGKFLIDNQAKLSTAIANEGIAWHFIPAHSPHFGGLWEAGVKSTKHHLKRVMGNACLTFEDLYTLLTQIEAILNSRPLSPLSTDPNDPNPLTPAHFLIGRTLTSVADPDVQHIQENRLSRYQRLQQLNQHFWTRWSKEYISELQQRRKWQQGEVQTNVGDLVILKEDNLPPLCWRLGRIIDVHPGTDNVVRVVSVKTTSGIVKRAIVKVCPLPIET